MQHHLNLLSFISGNLTKRSKAIVITFYIVMLITSSLFSSVYLTNLSYDKTYVQDTQSIAEFTVTEIMNASNDEINKRLYGDGSENGIANELRLALAEYQNESFTMPAIANMSFQYKSGDKRIVPPYESPADLSKEDYVPINGTEYDNDPQILDAYVDSVRARNQLNNTMKRLEDLNILIQDNLSQKNLSDNTVKQNLLNAYSSAHQLYAEIQQYREDLDKTNLKIKEYNDLYNRGHEEKSYDKLAEGYGYEIKSKAFQAEYLQFKAEGYEEFLTLLEKKDGEKETIGELAAICETLQAAVDREKILALFVETAMYTYDEHNTEEYKDSKKRLYNAVRFVTSYSTNTDIKSYQEFDKLYSEYELYSGIMNRYEAIQDNVSKTENGIEDDLSTETDEQQRVKIWKQNWRSIINDLHQCLLKMPSGDKYNSIKASNRLTKLYRDNFVEISAVEKAWNRLIKSKLPGKAIVAILFSVLMDMSSLVIGFIIYWRRGYVNEEEKHKS